MAVAGVLAVGASALVPTRADVARFAADGIARASVAAASDPVDAPVEAEEPATTPSDPVTEETATEETATEETVVEGVAEQPDDLPPGQAKKPDAGTSGEAKPEQAGTPGKPDHAGNPGKPDKSSD